MSRGIAAADGVLAFSIGIPASASEPDLAGTLHSMYQSAAAAGGVYEILVAVNGTDEPAPALGGVRAFARAANLTLREETVRTLREETVRGASPETPDDDPQGQDPDAGLARDQCRGGSPPVVWVLRQGERSKVAAWNAIRAAARSPVIVFGDADVRLEPQAIGLLLGRLEANPTLAVAAGCEAAALNAGDGLAARVAALPYRFDFGNIPGRLYALRTAALPEPMPPHVLPEDAYLSVRLGPDRYAKVDGAVVWLRPPTTWREYLDQRVRNELGKLQLAAEFPELLRRHGFGATPWRAMLHGIRAREYPLVALSLAARLYARARARRRARAHGFDRGWATLPSTKAWES